MKVETVEDLVEQLADWMGIFGGCKNPNDDRPQDKCTFDPKKPFCCRSGFTAYMIERIEKAVHNTEELNKIDLK